MKNGTERSPQWPREPDRDWVRSVPIKAMFRPPEADDLDTIAKGWGVPVATAVWAIVVEQLARWRRQAPELGPQGLAIAAAATVLQKSPRKLHAEPPVEPHRQTTAGGLHDNL